MSRQNILSIVVGIGIGLAMASFIKTSVLTSQLQVTSEAVGVASRTAEKYIDAYKQLADQKVELDSLVQVYENAKDPVEKSKIADQLVNKIKSLSH